MKKFSVFPLLLGVLFFSNTIFAQTQTTGVIGKLFTKTEANTLYGPVLKSVTINTSALSALLSRTPKFVLFNIINGQLYILNSNRSLLSGPSTALSASQQMRVASTSVFNQLIQKGGASTTTVELRGNGVLTVTNGNDTLEETTSCPPYCP